MTLRLASAWYSDLSLYKDNVQVIETWIDKRVLSPDESKISNNLKYLIISLSLGTDIPFNLSAATISSTVFSRPSNALSSISVYVFKKYHR